jgi:NADH-quinone oxidoreductase subunit J
MDNWPLYIFSFITIVTALGTIAARNPVYSVLSLILTFFSLSGHYILMNAQFLAAVNLIVYTGAIMVLFLFVLMLLNLNKSSEPRLPLMFQLAAAVSAGLLLVVLAGSLREASLYLVKGGPEAAEIGLVGNLGKALFTEFVVPFELSSILFLAAMVGAVMLGKRDKKKSSSEPA